MTRLPGAPYPITAPAPSQRSNFLKAYEYVNRVKQFKTKQAMARVRT